MLVRNAYGCYTFHRSIPGLCLFTTHTGVTLFINPSQACACSQGIQVLHLSSFIHPRPVLVHNAFRCNTFRSIHPRPVLVHNAYGCNTFYESIPGLCLFTTHTSVTPFIDPSQACACSTLGSYAEQCSQSGIDVNWREAKLCRKLQWWHI